MKRFSLAVFMLAMACAAASQADAQTTLRIGWCARTLSSAAAPFAVATKMATYAVMIGVGLALTFGLMSMR